MGFVPTMFEVEVTGYGRPVIFIPGFACSGPVEEPSLERIHTELRRYILATR